MSGTVLLAGTGTARFRQNHQRYMYLPAVKHLIDEGLPGSPTGVSGVFEPSSDPALQERAGYLAQTSGSRVIDTIDLTGVAAVIACPDADAEAAGAGWGTELLQAAADAGVPVLMDKPTLLPADVLRDWAKRFPTGVTAAHHPRFHPAITACRGRIATGGLGLLHAVHGELLVGSGDGPHPLGELRNLAVYALDVVQALCGYPLHGKGTAQIQPPGPDGTGESITISVRVDPDVVVTLLVGRSGDGDADDPSGIDQAAGQAGTSPAGARARAAATRALPGTGVPPVHRYRILGSHGQLLADLDSPVMDLYTDTLSRVPFGPSSLDCLVDGVIRRTAAQPDLASALAMADLITALETSNAEHRAVQF
ncbi:hypothetical protein [Nakamurella aerolata]|uniref:Dehydrogenase n=1 Tax=Nakamurella aerolata TaxID=1656892 RepID=A0A849A9I5_9ACTN|nr:hypothetical protein [Nakamurella aerolata]NNG35751.1 hypothetical protein [Nakamurella aerolata]